MNAGNLTYIQQEIYDEMYTKTLITDFLRTTPKNRGNG